MQMRAGDPARGADGADNRSRFHMHARFYIDLIQMTVHRDQTQPMIYEYCIAIEKIIAHIHYLTRRGRFDRRAARRGDIHARMRITRLAIEYPARAERGGSCAFNRWT